MKPIGALIGMLCLCATLWAQNYTVVWHSVEASEKKSAEWLPIPQVFSTESAAITYVQSWVPQWQSKGYIAASIDSIYVENNRYEVYVHRGDKYQWASLRLDSLPAAIQAQFQYIQTSKTPQKVSPSIIAAITEKTLQWSENNGYPFAIVSLEVASTTPDIVASFRWDKGSLQKLDSINIEGDVKISRNVLLQYLDLKQGDRYQEKKLRSITGRLNNLSYLQEDAPSKMVFHPHKNQLNIYIKERKSNSLSALVGLLPNSVETGKFLLTADAACIFQNILGNGEYMHVTYQNLQYRSPRFKATLNYPYLLQTTLGIDATFDLFKKDTAFRRTSYQAGLRYQFSADDYVRLFFQGQSNRLGNIDTQYVKTHKRLPDNADASVIGGGIEIALSRLNNRMNPIKGFEAKFSASVLQRRVLLSEEILALKDSAAFDYRSLYNTYTARTKQWQLIASSSYYFPMSRMLVGKLAYQGALLSGKGVFKNELYQIGGFRLLRGFDEQSIYANQYHVATAELRLLLDAMSYVYLFSDNGYVQSQYVNHQSEDIYNGQGAGAALQTKSGLFSIGYALGRYRDNPFSFRQSKIHFGYVTYF